MKNINPQATADELLNFAQMLANKLDTNTAFDQCYSSMTIDPLVRHKASVECEKNITPFGLLDEFAFGGTVVQNAVKEYLGEEIMEMVPSVSETLELLTGWPNKLGEDVKEIKAILKDSDLPEIMSPTTDYDRGLAGQWTVLRHLKEACEYLTSNKKWCPDTDNVRTEYQKTLRRKFKRAKFFTKDKETGSYTLNEDGIKTLFGASHPVLAKFVGTEVQVTEVVAKRDRDGDYLVALTFRNGTSFRVSVENTLTDVAQNIIERVVSHYQTTLSTAQELAEKGMPVTASWTNGTEEHKLSVLKYMGFECPAPLLYQVFWNSTYDGNSWNRPAYTTLPAGTEEEGYEPICKPTDYARAVELQAGKEEQRKIDGKIEDTGSQIARVSRELSELKKRLADLQVKKFDSQSVTAKVISGIAK